MIALNPSKKHVFSIIVSSIPCRSGECSWIAVLETGVQVLAHSIIRPERCHVVLSDKRHSDQDWVCDRVKIKLTTMCTKCHLQPLYDIKSSKSPTLGGLHGNQTIS